MTEPPAPPVAPDETPVPPVPGRGHPMADAGLRALRKSWILKASAVLAFMGYGGLIALKLADKLDFRMAGTVALMSLGSWFFLFWWLPVIERTRALSTSPRRGVLSALLETIAVGCVVLVHVLMAIIVVYQARS